MKWFICDNCATIFNEVEAGGRPATLEDGVEPWTRIMVCPTCGDDNIELADVCPLCGKPHAPTETTYCDGCFNYVKAGLTGMAWARGEGDNAEEALKDLICMIYKW